MPYRVFDRASTTHPFETVLERWLSRTPADLFSAIACNLVHDHRVTPEREGQLLDYFAREDGAHPEKGLVTALQKYLEREVKFRRKPAFLDRKLNAGNILPDPQQFGPRRVLPMDRRLAQPGPAFKNVWLARILDLNRLAPVFWTARWHRIPVFRDFPRKGSPQKDPQKYQYEVLGWLDENLGAGARYSREDFAAAVLEALELKRRRKPYQPTWATYWSHFRPLVPEGPVRWAAILGVPNGRQCAHWLMVLKYFQGEAGLLARPTILDAGFNPYHFPSPPQAALDEGGHPVDLQLSPRPVHLLPEFIHQQIPHTIEHWNAGGRLLARTPGHHPRPGWLSNRRHNHHGLLAKVYGLGVDAWMKRWI